MTEFLWQYIIQNIYFERSSVVIGAYSEKAVYVLCLRHVWMRRQMLERIFVRKYVNVHYTEYICIANACIYLSRYLLLFV